MKLTKTILIGTSLLLSVTFLFPLTSWTHDRLSEITSTHRENALKIAKDQEEARHVRDVERTLSLAYEHLSKWEIRHYTRLFLDFSKENGLPWEAYAALVRYESNFDPTQRSVSNCYGMTQVLPSTGKRLADSLGIRWRGTETVLYNDLLNMVLGFTYLSEGYKMALSEGHERPEALQYALKRYVGGTGDPIKIKRKTKENQIYVKEYKTSVWQECKKLMMFYRSVQFGEPDSLILAALERAELEQ